MEMEQSVESNRKKRGNARLIILAAAALLIVGVAGFAFYVKVTELTVTPRLPPQLNRGRQLFLATFQMATDATVEKNEELGLPGDLATRTGGVHTVSEFLQRLIKYDYLKESDVKNITAGPGMEGWSLEHRDAENNCAFKVYRYTERDGANTIAFASRNFTYGKDLDPKQMPFGDKGFVIIRKGGDGVIYKKQQARNLESIGLLPGRKDFNDRPIETAEDTLEQR